MSSTADFFTCDGLIFLDTASLFKTTWDNSGTSLFSKVIGCRCVDVGSRLFSLLSTLEDKLIEFACSLSVKARVSSSSFIGPMFFSGFWICCFSYQIPIGVGVLNLTEQVRKVRCFCLMHRSSNVIPQSFVLQPLTRTLRGYG